MSGEREWVTLARILRPQGRKGEVLAELFTDFPERLAGRAGLRLAREGFDGSAEEARACEVTESWLPKGKNEGRIVLAIAGVATITDAEALSGYEVLVDAEERAPLEEGAAYISDLVGCTVFDGERVAGTVREVQFPASADGRRRMEQATPLLVVDLADGEAMIPFAKEFVVELDVTAKTLRMRLPEGLLDLDSDAKVDEPD